MVPGNAPPSKGFEIFKIVLDKFFLALIVTLATAVLTLLVNRMQTGWKFQEALFDKRFESYSTIAKQAEQMMREMALLYNIESAYAAGPLLYPWAHRVAQLGNQFVSLQSGSTGGSWGDPSAHPERVIEALRSLVAYREEKIFLIPAALDAVMSMYVQTVTDELKTLVNDVKSWKADAQDITINEWEIAKRGGIPNMRERWDKVFMAYRTLLNTLRDVIGLDFSAHKPFVLFTGRE